MKDRPALHNSTFPVGWAICLDLRTLDMAGAVVLTLLFLRVIVDKLTCIDNAGSIPGPLNSLVITWLCCEE